MRRVIYVSIDRKILQTFPREEMAKPREILITFNADNRSAQLTSHSIFKLEFQHSKSLTNDE